MNRFTPCALACSFLILSLNLRAAEKASSDEKILEELTARPLGPANMGGRIAAVAVVENKPSIIYLATASGGLWKTVNNGTTWTPVFDHQDTVSLGDVAVARSNPDIVWAGTGEANARNSVSWGDGVYKSTDGGKTWQHVGLKDSAHIGRIVIHPTNPDIVYVAALGHLWGANKERGLYKTTDGGKTWEQVKFLSEDTGFIDLVMDPGDPNLLYAAAYQVRRGPFSGGNPVVQTGPDAGLYRTTDAGKTWTKMTRGLPDRPLGRCGLAVYRKDPRIVYAVVQTDKTSTSNVGQPPRTGSDPNSGGIFRSSDKGETWTKLNDLCPRPFYYGQIRIDPGDDRRIYVLGVNLFVSSDGGKTFKSDGAPRVHSDHHALWIDPHDSDHLVLGNDGGLYFSYDRGSAWEHVNNLPIGQYYGVAVDMRRPYRVYGGLQDNGSWGGPSATRNLDGITTADWYRVLGADGFHCQVDPDDPDTVYAEAQYGGLERINIRTGEGKGIRPEPPRKAPAYRFNWSSPILLSPHDPHTIYYGGNVLFRSSNRGDDWKAISPDLTRGQPGPSADGGHTITTIAESPLKAGVLYVGTDDGKVQVTLDGGEHWTDLSDKLPDVPPDRWITRIECSHFAEGTAYLSLDRHRNDDRTPYLFRTTDFGDTWKPLAQSLPEAGPVHVVHEDLRNKELLFAGTEFGLFVSQDGGKAWHRLSSGLPTVAVHDLVIHPRDRELVIGTHGRSIYVLDIAPLEELTASVRKDPVHLFDVKPATLFRYRGSRSWMGSRSYAAPNPPAGATVAYYLKTPATDSVELTIANASGAVVTELKAVQRAGLHRLTWPLRVATGRGPDRGESRAPPGQYTVKLKVGETVLTKTLRVVGEE